ncbi:tyrosine-protein kinase Fer-like isoform X1 [Asterias rubens]|uniref:tyrosine-protein kinase Fer-like isoform X1 n=1 Tax=Asterias rubens TaxID=7604 RepID=UPI001454FEE3|nr:tyrosine-protein kinase Fer-like isoform X1 [Asterias rubens]
MSSKVNELRQKFANTGGTPAVPPPGGVAAGVVPPPLPAARDRKISAPPVLPSGAGLRPPLPAIPQQKASSSAVRRISSSLDHNNSFLSNNSDENATNDAEDLYLSPDEELKASSQPSPTPIISSKPLPSPKVPPPRKPTSFNFNKSRPQSHSVSEVKVNGGRGGSGDGTFFHSTSNSSLPVNSPKESSSDSLLMFQYYAEEDLVSPLFWEGDNQARGASRMGFGTDLQDKTAHDAILKLNDQEYRLMEALKRVVQHKIKADKEYATSLGVIGTLANRFEEDSQINHKGNVVKTWSTIIKETEAVSKLIRQHADEMSTAIVDRLSMMIKDKMELKKQYIHERTKIDTDYMKVKGEVKESFSRYQKAGKETKELKLKYDEALIKGKSKDLEKAKDKYKKAVLKLHKTHNEYVLSLKAATLHQEHYRTSILPRLLECLQQSQESQIAQIKQTMSDLSNLSSTCMGDFVTSQNAVMRCIADVRPDVEYSNFVDNHKVDPPAREYFEFDGSILEDFPDGMEENVIVLDNLTLESVQHTHTSLGESLTEVRESLSSKKQELQTLDEEIRGIQPSPTDERILLDLLSRQKAYRDVSREIQDLKCQEAKLNAQYTMLDQKLSSMGDEDNLPAGLDLPEVPTNSMTLPTPEKKKLHLGSGVTRIFGKRGPDSSEQQQKQSVSDIPIEEEEWYHGALPRLETEELLVNDGDFLVREKSDASGQYVLSAKTNSRIRHFPIQLNEDNMYRLEGTAFPSVGHLIRYQLSSAVPVTKASQACLIHPVVKVRDEHDLRHEEIELGDKLGAGHFGDVFRGKLIKNGTPVAVKTCKETVDAATRRKFLMEANILKQYNHPNIVKLIGVCTDKHPIYIVMELVPGGDLLSFLRNDENDISTKQMVKMSEETGAGMAFLESKNCIHRDLAARNCLVGLKNTIKISDFGMSREDDVYTIKGGAMRQIPIKWTAPEAMNYGKYTTMSDVWSFGILLWEVFSHGSTPYPGMNNTEAREKVEQGYRMPPAHGTPDEMYTLMTRCWEYGDEHRPRFKEIHAILKRLTKTVK